MPIRMLLRLLQRRPEMFRLRLLLQRRPQPAAEVPSSSTGDQGWTAEEWELWTEAVKASNKKGSKGRKRKLQLYERFRSLKEQALWKGTDPKPKYPGQG